MTTPDRIRGHWRVFALTTIFAMAYQFIQGYNDNPDFRPSNVFSFFTIQSSIILTVVLLIAGLTSRGEHPTRRFDRIRDATVADIAGVGVGYGMLLSGYQEELQMPFPWDDNAVHRIIPLVMVADGLIDPPNARIGFRQTLGRVAYPIAYLSSTLIQGPRVDR